MAAGFQLGSSRKRSSSTDTVLLLFSCVVAAGAYFKFSPTTTGTWEAAATQAQKKLPRPVLFYPAWERDVLRRMQGLPVVLLDGPSHLDLAGLDRVLFAADATPPERIVENLHVLEEWRDFAGKPFAVLRVASHSLAVDLPALEVFAEEVPGIKRCDRDGNGWACKRVGSLAPKVWAQGGRDNRCLWVKTEPGREVSLRFVGVDLTAMSQAELFLTHTTDSAEVGESQLSLMSDDIPVANLAVAASKRGLERRAVALSPGTGRLEVTVKAEAGACVDVELLR